MKFENLIDWAVVCAYRLSTHALLNWAEDPALLAIIFC
jgi:hypothetical protein